MASNNCCGIVKVQDYYQKPRLWNEPEDPNPYDHLLVAMGIMFARSKKEKTHARKEKSM